jgi:hypothetical protein
VVSGADSHEDLKRNKVKVLFEITKKLNQKRPRCFISSDLRFLTGEKPGEYLCKVQTLLQNIHMVSGKVNQVSHGSNLFYPTFPKALISPNYFIYNGLSNHFNYPIRNCCGIWLLIKTMVWNCVIHGGLVSNWKFMKLKNDFIGVLFKLLIRLIEQAEALYCDLQY